MAQKTVPDGEAIKKATEELSNEMSKIGEAMSKATADAGQAGAETATGVPEEQPVEVNSSPEGSEPTRDAKLLKAKNREVEQSSLRAGQRNLGQGLTLSKN